MKNDEVKQFYNSFLKTRMIDYRLNDGNERINLASKFILKNINDNDNILEIGSGIGIITERISKKKKKGFIWACDISDQNIWYSKQTIPGKNIDFFVADIIEQFEIVKKRIDKKIDVFILIDVIEHIPKEQHSNLFKNLNLIASDNAKILLTFPSEFYQHYLKQNNPKELQIIDEIISIDDIVKIAHQNNFAIKYFELKDVWMNNQYVHCILNNNKSISDIPLNNNTSIIIRILNRFRHYFRRKKYIDKVFKEC